MHYPLILTPLDGGKVRIQSRDFPRMDSVVCGDIEMVKHELESAIIRRIESSEDVPLHGPAWGDSNQVEVSETLWNTLQLLQQPIRIDEIDPRPLLDILDRHRD